MEVVGVVGDVRDVFDYATTPKVYAPYGSPGASNVFLDGLYLAFRSASPEPAAAAREAAIQLEPEIRVTAAPLSRALGRRFELQRFQTVLLGTFAGVAVMLSMLGIYSVVAFATAQRRREIGIRIALGARGRDVVLKMMRQGLAPALAGLIAGLSAAYALSEVLRSRLHEVEPTDLRVYAAVFLLSSGLVLLGSWLPARRAARIDPVETLHEP